ncbi:prohibitin family protein [Phototrophicus methaneseepsis]|uniref:Prohibitin family protein n=1 Tax=Phototrophicus methaneseepsis TaxID=2710758 RepID=A0A7S8E8Q3_9CHLR|nr:prohibitin family protein [Phototrophicus methaneseepsis]QPC82450.1 prohibitin family protein [Phototrophicus methaneseepsis]
MDVSSVFQILALGGFLAGFAGVALVVAAASQNRPVRGGVVLAVAGILAGIVLLIVSQGLLVVGPTERAVVFNTVTGNLETPRQSGISIVIPGVQVVTIYPVSRQSYTMSGSIQEGDPTRSDAITARSVDGQQVTIDMTVIFRLQDGEGLNQIHRDWSNEPGGYLEGLIRPTIRSIVRDVVAGFEAESIYGIGREQMDAEIEARLTEVFADNGIVVTDSLVNDVSFSDEFINAIEAKQVEEQQLQRARTEAERRRAEAVGLADAEIERARGEAQAILIRAAADAEALRLVSQQIAANPNLIQYTYINELADNVNLALVPSNTPFLFNFDDFTELSDDFVPPEVDQPQLPDEVEVPEVSTESSEAGD